jgi:phosphate transport system protein
MVTPHLEAGLQRDLELIRSKLMAMTKLDVQALTRALQALHNRDRQLAYAVILREQDVDAAENELDRLCLEFILRHQPAAGILRFVYSASKVANELERIGDYAESIARQVLALGTDAFEFPRRRLNEIANLAIPMLQNAVRAFVEKNPDLARTTMLTEPRVNKVRDEINAELLAWRLEEKLPLEALAPLITVARRFERVSDQATNICEHALYSATGEEARHTSRSEGFRILFVDDTNGCLSRIAEAIARGMGVKRFSFGSAGVVAGDVDPQTILFLSGKGIDISHQPSRSVDEVPQLDGVQVLIALSGEADQALPKKPTKTLGLRWSVPDPSRTSGTPDQVQAGYEKAFQSLTVNIRELVEAIVGSQENGDEKIIPS